MKKYLIPEIFIEVINRDVLSISYDNTNFDYKKDNIADDIF